MIKDTQQKMKALRYCVSLGFVPHLEVVVRFDGDTNESPCDLTDIDVFGILPGTISPSQRVIFDCKTVNKISPISRALWAKGVMSITNSSEAFVILSKPAVDSHRLAGNSFGVRLFSEALFDKFAASASPDYLLQNSYLENVSAWQSLADIKRSYPKLDDLVYFFGSSAVLQPSATQGLRSLISTIRHVSGELDPSKAQHRAIFKIALAQFNLYVTEMVRDFHNIFDPDSDRVRFESTLRYYVWGGRENYELRQKLNAAIRLARGEEEKVPFEFPLWGKFVEFFRSCLDSPFSVGATCLPVKDMAFRELSTQTCEVDRRLTIRLKANNRVRQFSLSAAAYLCEAARLPREFRESFSSELNQLLAD